MFDLAVIGLGSAGIEAINIALKNNLSIIAFEKGELGGTCLNKGCIPTKAILHSANLYSQIKNAKNSGIIASQPQFNYKEIIKRKENIVSKFTNAINLSISKKITIINSEAKLEIQNNKTKIIAENKEYEAKNIIIATGSIPFELPDLEFDHKFILNSDDMFELDNLPKNVTIVGSGAIGLEWAQILSSLDSNVTIVEKAPNLAPCMDIDIQKRLARILKTKNIKFYKNDFIKNINEKIVKLNSGVEFETDVALVAVGRKKIYPKINQKLEINSDCSTNIENIYITGDCSNGQMLAHSASWQARKVMDKILFNKKITTPLTPSVIYITPEIASVGVKEQEIENKDEYKILKFMIPSLAKSWCDEANDGFIKVIMKDDLIKGAHVVSKNAAELISTFCILINQKIKKDEIQDTIFPHPSYSEAILEIIKNA